MTHSFLLASIYALAVYRITRLVTEDSITASLREWLRGHAHEEQIRQWTEAGNPRTETRIGERRGVTLALWKLATCSWCVSLWIAAGAVLGFIYAASWFTYAMAVFAFSAVAGLIADRWQ